MHVITYSVAASITQGCCHVTEQFVHKHVYVMLLWFELCDCLCMPLRYVYARFYDISMGHNTGFVVACNDLSLLRKHWFEGFTILIRNTSSV
jgi:hypothetical protein